MSEAWWRRIAWLALVLALVALYLPVLDSPFVYDDKIEVVGNNTIRDLGQWRAIASYNVSRPLLVLSYALDFHAHGLTPRGYHITNLVIAALAVGAALLMAEALLVLARVERPLLRAAAAVALWALHPMATEGFTYVTGRSESLCALCSFASLWAWARALEAERPAAGGAAAEGQAAEGAGRRGAAWRLLGLLGFVGAVMTKEVGAMIPAVALAMELLLGARAGTGLRQHLRRTRWAWYAPYLLLVGGAAWLRLQHATRFLPREVERPPGVQLTTEAAAWLHYLQLWLLPVDQTIFHHLLEVQPLSLHGVVVLGGWLLVVALAVAWGRKVPLAGFALLAGALFLLPSSSIVALKESMAEHRALQTGLWLALALVASVRGRAARPLAYALVPVLGLLAGLTHLRHRAWTSEVALWEEATARRPEVADAWYGLGDAHRFGGEFTEARAAYQRVVDLDPTNLDGWNNLGITLASLGDLEGARQAWKTALRESPSYCKAHSNLGVLAAGQKDWEEALHEYSTALAYCPDNTRAHLGLCELYQGPLRDREKAIHECQTFVDLAPTSEQAPRVKDWLLELTF